MKNGSILKNSAFACFAAVFCAALWGTAFPFIKLGYSVFAIAESDIGSKLLFAGIRFFAAGVMVYAYLCISQKKLALPHKSSFGGVLALGLTQTALQYIFTYVGIGFTSGTNTSIITSCSSFFTVLLAPLFFKSDRLTLLKVIGCVIGFAGVLAINGVGCVSFDTLLGDVLILCSTVCTTAGNFMAKGISQRTNPTELTAFQLMLGGFVLTAIGVLLGGVIDFKNLFGMLILLWLAFVSAAAFTVWTALLKYHPASKISVFNLLVPIFGTVLSGLMLGENIFKIQTLASLILISLGIAAVNLKLDYGRRKQ